MPESKYPWVRLVIRVEERATYIYDAPMTGYLMPEVVHLPVRVKQELADNLPDGRVTIELGIVDL